MKTYNTNTEKWEEYKPLKKDFGKSATDLSKWKPNVSINSIIESGTINEAEYEFKDGVDTGERIYPLRSAATDITERNEYMKNEIAKGEEAKKRIDKEVEKAALDSIEATKKENENFKAGIVAAVNNSK